MAANNVNHVATSTPARGVTAGRGFDFTISTATTAPGPAPAAAVAVLAGIGAPVNTIKDGKAGDAAALKILRSVFTKGLEALAVECLVTAEQQGVTDNLFAALADIDRTPLREVLEAFVRTHVIHAPRRLREAEEAERQLRRAHLPVAVLPGMRALFERTCADIIARAPIAGDSVPTAADAFAWLLANAQRHERAAE